MAPRTAREVRMTRFVMRPMKEGSRRRGQKMNVQACDEEGKGGEGREGGDDGDDGDDGEDGGGYENEGGR